MRFGIFGGNVATGPIDRVLEMASQVEADGFDHFFLPQIFELDAMTTLAVVGREVPRIALGTAVVPTYPRHPMVMAQQALTVQATTGGRFILGIGLSHQIVIEHMLGYSFDKPATHMREYLAVLMPLLREQTVSFSGATISGHVTVTIKDAESPPVLVAALGEKMLQIAGALADGTMTWMTGPATLAQHIVPNINSAASDSGRPLPRVGAALPVMVTNDASSARELASREFAIYNELPSYRAMLDREGATGPGDVAIVGTATEVRDAIAHLEVVGVTDFVAVEYGDRDARARTRETLVGLL